MIIGVDAGALSITDDRLKVGVWRITYNLLRELGKLDTKNSYRLYSFLPIDPSVLREFGPTMTNILLPKLGFASIRLPLELTIHPVEVFLGLSQVIAKPVVGNTRTIGFIYDVGFLHHPELYPDSYTHLGQITTKTATESDHIVTISHTSANDITKFLHVPKDKISVIYPGVGDEFTPKGNKQKSTHPYFLMVGSLKRGKNIPFAIRAFGKFLEKQKTQYNLLIAGGDYWRDPAIDTTIRNLKLKNRVKQLGFVKDKTLADYYRGAVALLCPSISEGFCLPAAEALSCGCSVIAANSDIFREIVGDNGHLLELDENKWSIAMQRVVGHRMPPQSMRKYSWNQMAKDLLNIL